MAEPGKESQFKSLATSHGRIYIWNLVYVSLISQPNLAGKSHALACHFSLWRFGVWMLLDGMWSQQPPPPPTIQQPHITHNHQVASECCSHRFRFSLIFSSGRGPETQTSFTWLEYQSQRPGHSLPRQDGIRPVEGPPTLSGQTHQKQA